MEADADPGSGSALEHIWIQFTLIRNTFNQIIFLCHVMTYSGLSSGPTAHKKISGYITEHEQQGRNFIFFRYSFVFSPIILLLWRCGGHWWLTGITPVIM